MLMLTLGPTVSTMSAFSRVYGGRGMPARRASLWPRSRYARPASEVASCSSRRLTVQFSGSAAT